MLIDIPVSKAYSLLTGSPTVMVTSQSPQGVDNVMANAWNTLFEMGEHPQVIVVLDKCHTTFQNILFTKEFGISIPGTAMRREMLISGTVHGRDVGDKFQHLGIEKMPSTVIKAPLVKGALAHLECRLVDERLFENKGIAIGEIVAAHVREPYWDGAHLVTDGQEETTMHAAGSDHWFTRGTHHKWSEKLRD